MYFGYTGAKLRKKEGKIKLFVVPLSISSIFFPFFVFSQDIF